MRKRPTARRCRPASRLRRLRWRSPIPRSRAFCNSCADRGETFDKPERRGLGPAVFYLPHQPDVQRPTRTRSRGRRSSHGRFFAKKDVKKRRGKSPAAAVNVMLKSALKPASMKSAQELQNALLRGTGERQRRYRDRLAGRQRLAVAASSLESASVRLDEPVCNTLISFFEKSWRISTIDRLAPKAEACERSSVLAVLSAVRTFPVRTLSVKSVPALSEARPRPAGLKVTPAIVRVDFPVSSKISFSELPSSRLMPLKDASCAVVAICWMIRLYWLTRVARAFCDTGSGTAATTAPPAPPPAALALILIASSVAGAAGAAVPVIT